MMSFYVLNTVISCYLHLLDPDRMGVDSEGERDAGHPEAAVTEFRKYSIST